ncbi:MAG: hypothetical protein HY290_13225 [Planctomycetia bacterium]|nr:hypothetical protein [Planctomycetia bacterium]
MNRVAALSLAVCLVVLAAPNHPARAADPPDLSKIKRRIAKEPAYTAIEPLYALYVFGPRAATHVWAVLDKSKPDAPHYDVLFFDRNADGDLTAADERIEGKVNGDEATFEIGSFTDPKSKQTHTGLSIRRNEGENSITMFRMNWCDKVSVRGGYAPASGPYTQFAATPAEAPILWPGADGSFSFQFWMLDTLHVGGSEEVRVFLGHRGIGKNTFCAVPDTFLPKDIPVIATLIYRDKEGKEQRARSELRERC